MAAFVKYKMKRFFFDRKRVETILGKKSARAISKALAFVRTRARSSLRRRKGVSSPGSPPSVHSQDSVATLKNIWFALDTSTLSGVVGPLALNQHSYFNGVLTSGTVPALHEFGGTAGIREKKIGKSWFPVGRRRPRPGQPTRVRLARYAPRPFMLPALQAEAPKFPALWLTSGGAAA